MKYREYRADYIRLAATGAGTTALGLAAMFLGNGLLVGTMFSAGVGLVGVGLAFTFHAVRMHFWLLAELASRGWLRMPIRPAEWKKEHTKKELKEQ